MLEGQSTRRVKSMRVRNVLALVPPGECCEIRKSTEPVADFECPVVPLFRHRRLRIVQQGTLKRESLRG